MSHKTRSVLTVILSVLLVLTLLFIWSNSMKSIPQSRGDSDSVLHWIEPFLEFFVGMGNVTSNLVRKLAHFVEFGALGVELALLLAVRNRLALQPLINCLFLSLLAALTDETIQIFYDRGSQVQDVLLDFSGACCGLLGTALLLLLLRKKPKAPV